MNWWVVGKDRKTWSTAIHKVVAIHTYSTGWKRVIFITIIIDVAS
jgi:hypothetical protein